MPCHISIKLITMWLAIQWVNGCMHSHANQIQIFTYYNDGVLLLPPIHVREDSAVIEFNLT